MIWLLCAKDMRDPDSPAVFYEPLDGDMKKVKLVDTSVDFGKWGIQRMEQWASGRWVDPTLVPTRLTMTSSHGGRLKRDATVVPDFIHCLFAQLVSANFRSVVEQYDPDQHQFLPVRMEWKSGEWVGKDYFWMAPGNRVFAMDVIKTQPPMIELRSGPDWHNPRPDRPAKRFAIGEPINTWTPVFIRDEI